jgi:hypothetical protein
MDIVASGHEVNDMDDGNISNKPTTFYTFTSNTVLDKSTVFQNAFSYKLTEILENALSNTELEQEVKDGLIKKLKDIDNKKCLMIPFKIGTNYKIIGEINGRRYIKTPAKLRSVRWKTNHDTYKLNCSLVFEMEKVEGPKRIEISINDYGKLVVPEKMEYWNNNKNSNINILHFTDLGMLDTVELTDGLQRLIVDNSYLYWSHSGNTSVIGEWDYETGTLIISAEAQRALAKNDTMKALKNNITLLNAHKHLIMPYNLGKINKINVKEKRKQ